MIASEDVRFGFDSIWPRCKRCEKPLVDYRPVPKGCCAGFHSLREAEAAGPPPLWERALALWPMVDSHSPAQSWATQSWVTMVLVNQLLKVRFESASWEVHGSASLVWSGHLDVFDRALLRAFDETLQLHGLSGTQPRSAAEDKQIAALARDFVEGLAVPGGTEVAGYQLLADWLAFVYYDVSLRLRDDGEYDVLLRR